MPRGQSDGGFFRNDTKQRLRTKCEFLNVVITDEISMTARVTWESLEKRLRIGKGISEKNIVEHPYGDVSILAVGDFFQLPPVMVKRGRIMTMASRRAAALCVASAWNKFSAKAPARGHPSWFRS